MSILRDIVGIASELLTLKNPYEKREAPRLIGEIRDGCGRVVVQRMRANSASEASRHLQGTTVQGDKSRVVTHRTDIRRGVYDIHDEDWQTNGIEQKFVDPRHKK